MANYDESRSRKLNRYAAVSYMLQNHIGAGRRYVGLSGHYAGDLGMLLGYNFDPNDITLFDTNKSAVKDARWRFKDMPPTCIVQMPIEKGISKVDDIGFVYLDFGDTPDAGNMKVIKQVAQSKGLCSGCYLAVSFTVGKENGNYEGEAAVLEKHVKREWDDIYAYFTDAEAPYMPRALYVTAHVLLCKPKAGGKFHLERVWVYESREEAPGVYLLTVLFKVMARGVTYSAVQQVINAVRHPNFRLPGKEAASRYLGKLTCRLLGNQDPTLMLNITKGTVSAYRRLGKNGWYD